MTKVAETFTVEDNIPIPAKKWRAHRRRYSEFTNTLAKLKVGQSFTIKESAKKVSSRASKWAGYNKKNWKFTVRSINKTTTRIWRIE